MSNILSFLTESLFLDKLIVWRAIVYGTITGAAAAIGKLVTRWHADDRDAAVTRGDNGERFDTHATAGEALLALHDSALAGELELGGNHIDLLFDPSTVVFDFSATFVAPQRKLKNVQD